MRGAIGKKRWAIAEGYIPPGSTGETRDLLSHEALCILNTNNVAARLQLTVYFGDREPAGPYSVEVPARRTLHLRTNDLFDPEAIPAGKDYACIVESDRPVVIQHTRLDSRQSALGLLSTIAFGAD